MPASRRVRWTRASRRISCRTSGPATRSATRTTSPTASRHQTLSVGFRVAYAYPVVFTRDAFGSDNPVLADAVLRHAGAGAPAPRVLAVLDGGLVACQPALPARVAAYLEAWGIVAAGAPLVLPGGEAIKADAYAVDQLLAAISQRAIDRHACVLALGGGALLDVAGYAAAIAHRGVRLIRMPTTVLAANDAGVGVKNGINAFGKKNFLGTFAPPTAVIDDLALLATLDDRDWRAGCSEAVKVALLEDPAFFATLERDAGLLRSRASDAAMEALVQRCAQLHVEHIASGGDPFEQGSARPLDFGHWSAHKLEALSGLRLRHGEAVAIGIALDVTYAWLAGLLSEHDRRRVLALLAALGLPLDAPELDDPRLLDGLDEFREHLGGRLTVTLVSAIGVPIELHEIDRPLMRRAVGALRETAAALAGAAAVA